MDRELLGRALGAIASYAKAHDVPQGFVLPRKGWNKGAMTLRTSAPVFRVLKEEYCE